MQSSAQSTIPRQQTTEAADATYAADADDPTHAADATETATAATAEQRTIAV